MMDNSETSDSISTVRLLRGRLVSGFRWLSQPAKTLSESERRRAHLLAWLLLFLILLSIIALLLVFLKRLRAPTEFCYRRSYRGTQIHQSGRR